jgi:hypothetical protein
VYSRAFFTACYPVLAAEQDRVEDFAAFGTLARVFWVEGKTIRLGSPHVYQFFL